MSPYIGCSSKGPLFRVKCIELFVVTFLILAATQFSEAVLLNAKSQPTSEILVSEQDLEDLSHVRAKRAVPANSKKSEISPMATNVHLNNSHLHLMVHWAGQGSPVLFCLGRDQEMKPGATSQVFRSNDYGLTYSDISSRFLLENGESAVINKFYHHPKSNCRYVFTDTVNRYIFMSEDCGETVTWLKLETVVPSFVDFDERRDRVFLIHDLVSPDKRLYVTKTFGKTFSPVQDYVKAFFLRYLANETELYVQRLEPSTSDMPGLMLTTILSSTNFFEEQTGTKIIYVGAKEFQLMGNYLFVTRPRNDGATEKNASLDLFISAHGERFVQAKFEGVDEKNLTNIDYHLVDVTDDGEIIIVVNHNSVLSNLYTSSRVTPYEVTFSLSLERVMYYSPNVTWHDSWLAATAGDKPFADVYKVQGLRGIYIASQLNQDAWASLHSGATSKGSSSQSVEPKDLVSLITFNGGSLWSPIRGPSRDEEGRNIADCAELQDSVGGCSLHLAQQLSKKFPSTRSIPIMTSPSAIGIIMGTGNVGKHLKQRSNVFLSADAGVSWHQVLKGSHYFHLGDHGGVIVAVKYFKTEGSTNELLYSTNEGINWEKLVFYSEPLRVFGLLTEPGENTTVFTIFGTTGGTSSINWIIVRVDLRSVFERNCTEDDYKRWSPSDNSVGKHRSCLLGRKEVYERRIVNAKCYNGRDRERLAFSENCVCDRSDYQCDFGFHRDQDWSGACVRDPLFEGHDYYRPPTKCRPGQFYNQTRGYIKIRGDTCTGGRDNVYEPLKVACPVEEEKEFLLVAQRPNILRIDLRNLSHVDILPLTQIQNVIALEFDLAENCVIYGDIELDKIFIQCLNGTAPRVLVENNLSVEGMSLDWIGKVLYFVDGQKRTIELVRTEINYSGRMRKTILDKRHLGKPRGIVVHPKQGLLFYSDWHEDKPHIGRTNMDGTDQKVLFKAPVVQWPNGLSIDPLANRLYWVDAQKDYISSCDLEGKSLKRVLEHNSKLVHPFSVTIHKELVYWDDWEKKAIFMADKNFGKGVVKVMGDLAGAMDMKAFSSLHQVADTNSCSDQPCSHLCVPVPNGYACLCPDGLKRHEKADGSIACLCADDKTEAYANGTCPATTPGGSGLALMCDPGSQFSCDNHLCVPKLWHCDGDDDCGDGSDEKDCGRPGGKTAVCRANQFACSNGEKCIPELWRCDFDNDCSDWSDEADCNRTTCGANLFPCANGQCISSKWRCDLEKDCQDGSDEENCTQVLPECKEDEFPCGPSGQCLPDSWRCDGENDCPSGEDEKDCDGNKCHNWQFGCADGQCIFQTWQCDGDKDCADGSDEANCTDYTDPTATAKPFLPVPIFPKGSECNEWMFRCNNEQCIPYWWKCDGSPDCADRSDELECGQIHTQPGFSPPDNEEEGGDDETHENVTNEPGTYNLHCGPTKFACPSGECIWQAWVCDGQNDCDNGEDEAAEICAGRPPPCDPNVQFRCERSGQCISYDQICDHHQDCTDNSDEIGCESFEPTPGPTTSDCTGPGVFKCDFDQCFPDSAICDGHLDCVDGTDEPNDCQTQHHVPSIAGLGVSDEAITSHSVRLDWILSDVHGSNLLEYQPAFSIAGENRWTFLNWTKLPEMSFTFTGLFPFTKYNFKISLRSGNDIRNGSIISEMTSPDIPGPPTITDVKKIKENVQIDWTAPSQPNGVLLKYVVQLYPINEDGSQDLSVGGGARVWMTETASQTTYLIGSLDPDQKYNFTVKAINTHYTGVASIPFPFVYKVQNKERVSGLEVKGNPSDNSVVLRWKKSAGGDNIEYKVSTKSDNLIALHGDILVNNSVSNDDVIEATVTYLSPNTSYVFGVAVIVDGVAGPFERVLARTTGRSLPRPTITDAQITPESGTAIKLSWQLSEDEKRSSGWTYGIYYGTNQEDLLLHGCRNTTDGFSFTVKHLAACESYSFVVAIVGDKGFSLPSAPFTKLTKYSPGAPPKNLKAELDPENKTRIVLTWQSSCSSVEDIGYLIFIEDLTTGQKNQVKLVRQNVITFKHVFDLGIHFGTTYRFFVKTDDPNSVPSAPVNISTIPIPVPESFKSHVDENASTHVIIWTMPEKRLKGYLLEDFKKGLITYRLYLSSHSNMSTIEMIINVTSSNMYRLPFSELEVGRLYFVAVSMVDKDGYESRMTDPVAIESPVSDKSIVVSTNNVAGVLLPIMLIIVVLGAALAYYVHRNRRLTRSFQEFASRYSPASGSASILNHSALDDDDDYSPIIRGFSDNEPLVVSS